MFLEATSRNFDRLGEEAVSLMDRSGVTLTDAVVQIAKREKLNPVEIERLVQRANTAATLQVLGSEHGGSVEFELAEYKPVMTHLYPKQPEGSKTSTGTSVKTAGEIPLELPNLRRRAQVQEHKVQLPILEKTAQENTPPLQRQVFQAAHKVESLRQEKLACELRIQQGLDYLLSEFSKVRCPDFGKFAAETYSLHGKGALPVLTSLAQALREPQDFSKTAAIIDDRTELHTQFKGILSGLMSLVKVAKDFTEATLTLKEQRTALREAARC
ncbi:MAG: hypothetical protein LHW56_01510 [Candidatus Cloacimonetes bacterium]|nr:hypothetical protein [Candidatus Cloacimonadota bacterium]MDY0171564.1 hypothetical protein [Candidatus Cloacimonadaceae bacterium]